MTADKKPPVMAYVSPEFMAELTRKRGAFERATLPIRVFWYEWHDLGCSFKNTHLVKSILTRVRGK